MTRKEFRDLASPAEAEETIASLDLSPGATFVPLADARGRVLAQRIDAGIDVPGFDRASLDGYALRAGDTVDATETDPVELAVVDTVHAGEQPDVDLGESEAVEISTGAVMPETADAMVPVEQTDEDGTADERVVSVRTAVAPGQHVMNAGADIAAGERALGPGTRLTPREIGLLSAIGIDEVPVRGRPAVGVVSTGDELVLPDQTPDHERGEIHDVNSYAIAAAVAEAGGEPQLYSHVADDPAELEATLHEAAAECDLVLTSGSTSASTVDVVYEVIEDRGDLLLHGVALKPGKPTLIGRLDGAAYVGLPGYPVSAMMVFRTLVAPVIREAAGHPEPERATVSGEFAVEDRFDEGRQRLVPVGLVETGPPTTDRPDDPRTLVYPVDKGSGATTSLADADGIVTVPPDTAYLGAGETVEVELFSPDVRPPPLLGVGEDDPLLSELLDRLDRPRHLAVGSREGLRRLRGPVPDYAVIAGPLDRDDERTAREIGRWEREWGLVVPQDSSIGDLGDLIAESCRFVNRTTDSGLRASFGEALAALADDRGVDRHEIVSAIDGFENTRRAHESPPRVVADGDADAALGLRATAARLDLDFVSLGSQPVRVLAVPDRLDKPAFGALRTALDDLDVLCADLPGYETVD
jgi:putative molybdopterin biosynthesis protein